MKKIGFLFLAAVAMAFVSCSPAEEVVEPVTYNLDAANSTLSWKGSMAVDYFHTGTVDFKSGSITMEGDSLTAGSFVLDMTSIKNTDLEDKVKASYLEGHLMGTIVDSMRPQNMFFNTPEYPTVEVKLGAYKDGMLTTTLVILETELTQDVAVKLTADEKGASLTGKFSMDIADAKIPGFAPSEQGSIATAIEFDLNLKLTK